MKHIRWIALALLIGIVAAAGVWASLNLNNTSTEATSTDASVSEDQTASSTTLDTTTQPASNTDTTQVDDSTSNNNEGNNNSANGPRINSDNSSNSSNNSNNAADNVEVSIGRGSWETDKDVPPFLVMKTIFEDWLKQEDREEYNLFEMDIYVNSELTRYLAVGKLFQSDVEKIPSQLKPRLNPWVKAKYTGDFDDYRVYELE